MIMLESYKADFIDRRLDEIGEKLLCGNNQYNQLHEQTNMICKSIINLDDPELGSSIIDYEVLNTQIESLVEEIVYEQAFKDGIEFYKMVVALIK